MKSILLVLGLLLCLGTSSMAGAQTLDEAKAGGLVGERVDGYVGIVVANPSTEIRELVNKTNAGRRKVYEDLAKRNDITVEAVGVVSGEKLRDQARPGEYIQSSSGQWMKK